MDEATEVKMVLFALCVVAGWRAYSWKAPLIVAVIAVPLNLLLVWNKIGDWQSLGLGGRVEFELLVASC